MLKDGVGFWFGWDAVHKKAMAQGVWTSLKYM